MPKKPAKKPVKKPSTKKPASKPKTAPRARKPQARTAAKRDVLKERMEQFGTEVEATGKKIGDRMEKRGHRCDNWFHNTFGAFGPFLSSIFGIVILAMIIWAIGFVNIPVQSTFMSNIRMFLIENFGLLFLISLLFSYSSYFSRGCPGKYRPFSPIFTAAGITTVFWLLSSTIKIANTSIDNGTLADMAFYIDTSIFMIFWAALLIGYMVLLIKETLRRSRPMEEDITERTAVKKYKPVPYSYRRTDRLYRSGRDKILGGVCGGVAEYFGVDPVLIRLLWVLGTLAWGAGILFYIICWIIIPRNPEDKWE